MTHRRTNARHLGAGVLTLGLALIAGGGCDSSSDGGDGSADDPCLEFCDAVVAADCEDPYTDVCERECGIGRNMDGGSCLEQYAAELRCYVAETIECDEGVLVFARTACDTEVQALNECLGLESGGPGVSSK